MQPVTLDERLAHIADAKRKHDTRIPWLADSMTNDLKHAFGDRNNSEFIISPEGEVLVARDWSDPEKLRAELEEFVGKSETLTEISDLDRNLERAAPETIAARGVVPRVKRPSGATPLLAKAVLKEDGAKAQPLYVKLRAEAPKSLLQGGKGQLYLGFHLDPVHHVHWNNLAAPLKFEITAPEGIEFSAVTGEAPKVGKAEADLDPREFLIDVDFGGERPKEPLKLRVDYFACDDGDQWCKAVSQEYTIEWREDRDGGRARSDGGGKGRTRPAAPGGRRPMPNAEQIMTRLDQNEDGMISKEEARGPIEQRFGEMDLDSDGFVSAEEIRKRFGENDTEGEEKPRRKRPPLETE